MKKLSVVHWIGIVVAVGIVALFTFVKPDPSYTAKAIVPECTTDQCKIDEAAVMLQDSINAHAEKRQQEVEAARLRVRARELNAK